MGPNLILYEVTNAITFVLAIYCKSVSENYERLTNENFKLLSPGEKKKISSLRGSWLTTKKPIATGIRA